MVHDLAECACAPAVMTHLDLKKKRTKSYYLAPQSKRKKPGWKDLCPGMTGILISTNDQEKFCVPEAYNLLNEGESVPKFNITMQSLGWFEGATTVNALQRNYDSSLKTEREKYSSGSRGNNTHHPPAGTQGESTGNHGDKPHPPKQDNDTFDKQFTGCEERKPTPSQHGANPPGLVGVVRTPPFNTLNQRVSLISVSSDHQYAEQLYGPELSPSDGSPVEEDVASSLTQEVNRLRGSEPRRFQAINSGAKHLIFVQCHLPVDPVQLVYLILSDLMKTKQCKSRYCQRMIPVSTVCRAIPDDIQKHIPDLLAPHFYQSDVLKKFAVVYKARNNNDVDREEIIKTLASLATRNGEYPHTVDLKNPDLTIIVEIIKSNCCVSVIREFNELKRYNVHSIMETFKVTPQSKVESKGTEMTQSRHETASNTLKTAKEITTDDETSVNTDDATTEDGSTGLLDQEKDMT